LLLPSTCSRVSLKTDVFAYNPTTLIHFLAEEKNVMPIATLASVFPRLRETGSTQYILNLLATRSA
jgi:hypothetical protein